MSASQPLPSYTMQTFLSLQGICDQMDKLVHDFLWGYDDDNKRHLYLKAWTSVCALKVCGGFGFRLFRHINKVFITKLGWKLCSRNDKPWVKLIKSKYLRGKKFWDFTESSKN